MLAATIALLGVIFVGVGVLKARHEEASRSWPTTDAVVTSSGSFTYQPPGRSDALPQQSSAYRYVVDGHTYEFRRSGYLGHSAPLAPDTRVAVRYDPSDPSDHAFDFERSPHRPIFEGAGGLCLLLSLPLWYVVWRLSATSREARPAT